MFRKEVTTVDSVVKQILRQTGLEQHLQELRVISLWDRVMGKRVSKYTAEKFIRNHVLYIKITSPALRQNLSMQRSMLIRRLNRDVGATVIADIIFY